jgi:hypothetical protein
MPSKGKRTAYASVPQDPYPELQAFALSPERATRRLLQLASKSVKDPYGRDRQRNRNPVQGFLPVLLCLRASRKART